jgi:hypothetical protein
VLLLVDDDADEVAHIVLRLVIEQFDWFRLGHFVRCPTIYNGKQKKANLQLQLRNDKKSTHGQERQPNNVQPISHLSNHSKDEDSL